MEPVQHYGSYRENFSDIQRYSRGDTPEAAAFTDAWEAIESYFNVIDAKLEEEKAHMQLLILQNQCKFAIVLGIITD